MLNSNFPFIQPIKLNRLLVFRNCARHGIMLSSSSLALCKLSVDACNWLRLLCVLLLLLVLLVTMCEWWLFWLWLIWLVPFEVLPLIVDRPLRVAVVCDAFDAVSSSLLLLLMFGLLRFCLKLFVLWFDCDELFSVEKLLLSLQTAVNPIDELMCRSSIALDIKLMLSIETARWPWRKCHDSDKREWSSTFGVYSVAFNFCSARSRPVMINELLFVVQMHQNHETF